jgi:hypothetical protein
MKQKAIANCFFDLYFNIQHSAFSIYLLPPSCFNV